MYQRHQTHSQLRFSKSCLSTFGLLSSCSRVKKLLAFLLALAVCEFVTPCPNVVWSWRRGSESGSQELPFCQVPSHSISKQIKRLRSFLSENKPIRGIFELQELTLLLAFTWSSLDLHLVVSWILLELSLEVERRIAFPNTREANHALGDSGTDLVIYAVVKPAPLTRGFEAA